VKPIAIEAYGTVSSLRLSKQFQMLGAWMTDEDSKHWEFEFLVTVKPVRLRELMPELVKPPRPSRAKGGR